MSLQEVNVVGNSISFLQQELSTCCISQTELDWNSFLRHVSEGQQSEFCAGGSVQDEYLLDIS
jgi:hypothetical protein